MIVYDNDSYIHIFPMGVAALAAVLEKEHEVDILHQDVERYPDSYITEYLDNHEFDMVGLSFTGGYYQYRKAVSISQAVNRSRKRPFYVLGGHGPSPEPAFFMRKTGADAVCIGEGEETVLELAKTLSERGDLRNVAGLAYRDGNEYRVNPRRPLIKDIDALPIPAYHRFPVSYYRLLRLPHCVNRDFTMPMLSGRGCPYTCNFCYRMDEGFRPRGNEAILEEINLLRRDYGITRISFHDELLMSSASRTESFCEELLRNGIAIKWDANGRLNFAKPGLLRLMRKAGCVFLNYGIEQFDDKALKAMNKALTEKQITEGIEATLAAGISPGLNIIFGNRGDTLESLEKSVDFLIKYDDGAQLRTIRPVTPYPGSPLYYEALGKSWGIADCEDFYENKHTNSDLLSVNFTGLTDEQFYDALYNANRRLLENYDERRRGTNAAVLDQLYRRRDANFRGFRQT